VISQRSVVFTIAAGVKTRTETYQGREHLVVPVVALVEGVVHALNSKYPEFVAAEEFSRAPTGWNGRPLFYGHPLIKGRPVSGNTPSLLEAKSIGIVFNTAVKSSKLTMEAWIDVEKATTVAPELLDRVAASDPIEISVGAFVETDESEGEFEGKKYLGAWHDLVPDHLALLPEGDEGACSRKMGCGVRAAKGTVMPAEDKKTERQPSILGKFLAMFRAAQPAGDMSNQDLSRKLYEALRLTSPNLTNIEAWLPANDPNRVVYSCYERSAAVGQEDCMGYQYAMYERAFTLDANGTVTIGPDAVEVEPVLSYLPVLMSEEPGEGEPTVAAGKRNSAKDLEKIQAMHDHSVALGAYCDPKMASSQKNASAGASCSCGGHAPTVTSQGEAEMKSKEEITKFLATATPEQITALSAVVEGKQPEEPKVAAATVETPKVEAPKPPTFAEILATASPEQRDSINEGMRVASERKAATIKALKDTGRCSFTDESLAKMSQAELDQLVALAGSNVRAAVDFSVNTPKDLQGADKKDVVAAPPSLEEKIKAAQAAKK
jgi:hypothetical protein